MKSMPALLVLTSVLFLAPPTICTTQTGQTSANLLTRRYREGEKLSYHMKATNRDRTKTIAYEIDAVGVVKKTDAGRFVEEFAWTNFIMDKKPANVTPAVQEFRQTLSLDPGAPPSVPNLSQVVQIVGPITDLLTFYADLWLSIRLNKFAKAGDHLYFDLTANTPSSWADGVHTLIGEDVIAFDITLAEVDAAHGTALLKVRHVPPANPKIKLPAEWMRAPVADTPNNWVQLQKESDGKYAGMVGKETFDDELTIRLSDGKILSATMDNPVEVMERGCKDMALTNCGEPMRYQIRRQVEIKLQD